MDEIDSKIKKLLNTGTLRSPTVKSSDCPDTGVLHKYINGVLGEKEMERVQQHVMQCSSCIDQILVNGEISEDTDYKEYADAPMLLKERAKNLHTAMTKKQKPGLFDVVLQLAKETIDIISNPGHLGVNQGAVPELVRSASKILSPNMIILSKTFSDMESNVEVERIDDRHVSMKIRTIDIQSRTPASVLRVSLLNPDRELASYVTNSGEVYFGNLDYGEYEIKIIRNSEVIGTISLNIILSVN